MLSLFLELSPLLELLFADLGPSEFLLFSQSFFVGTSPLDLLDTCCLLSSSSSDSSLSLSSVDEFLQPSLFSFSLSSLPSSELFLLLLLFFLLTFFGDVSAL